jgi:hypothetical protein
MMDTFSKIVGATILVVALTIGTILLNAWVLVILWGWFMVPLFGLPALNIPYAIGIQLVLGLLRRTNSDTAPSGRKWYENAGIVIGTPLFALLIGYIVKGFL